MKPSEPYWLEWMADYWPNDGEGAGDWEIERLGEEGRIGIGVWGGFTRTAGRWSGVQVRGTF